MDFTTSARDELTNELSQWCTAGEMEFVTACLDRMEQEVLHQAAEKVRGLRDNCMFSPEVQEYRILTGAANYIDPEVSA